MATFKLQQDSIALLSDETKAKFDSDGKIIELCEINEELKQIAEGFLDVFHDWIHSSGYAGECIRCEKMGVYQLELLCGRKEIELNTIQTIQPDGTIQHFLMKYKDEHFSSEPLPNGIPYKSKFDAYFDKEHGLLHITINPKISVGKIYTPNGEKGLYYKLKKLDINPKFAALYKLFLNHTNGIIATNILNSTELFTEYISLYENETSSEHIKKFKDKIEEWLNLPKKYKSPIPNKIGRMISELNKTLVKNDNLLEYHKVRLFRSKQKWALYFIPIVFLNERDDIRVDSKGKPIEKNENIPDYFENISKIF